MSRMILLAPAGKKITHRFRLTGGRLTIQFLNGLANRFPREWWKSHYHRTQWYINPLSAVGENRSDTPVEDLPRAGGWGPTVAPWAGGATADARFGLELWGMWVTVWTGEWFFGGATLCSYIAREVSKPDLTRGYYQRLGIKSGLNLNHATLFVTDAPTIFCARVTKRKNAHVPNATKWWIPAYTWTAPTTTRLVLFRFRFAHRIVIVRRIRQPVRFRNEKKDNCS